MKRIVVKDSNKSRTAERTGVLLALAIAVGVVSAPTPASALDYTCSTKVAFADNLNPSGPFVYGATDRYTVYLDFGSRTGACQPSISEVVGGISLIWSPASGTPTTVVTVPAERIAQIVLPETPILGQGTYSLSWSGGTDQYGDTYAPSVSEWNMNIKNVHRSVTKSWKRLSGDKFRLYGKLAPAGTLKLYRKRVGGWDSVTKKAVVGSYSFKVRGAGVYKLVSPGEANFAQTVTTVKVR